MVEYAYFCYHIFIRGKIKQVLKIVVLQSELLIFGVKR